MRNSDKSIFGYSDRKDSFPITPKCFTLKSSRSERRSSVCARQRCDAGRQKVEQKRFLKEAEIRTVRYLIESRLWWRYCANGVFPTNNRAQDSALLMGVPPVQGKPFCDHKTLQQMCSLAVFIPKFSSNKRHFLFQNTFVYFYWLHFLNTFTNREQISRVFVPFRCCKINSKMASTRYRFRCHMMVVLKLEIYKTTEFICKFSAVLQTHWQALINLAIITVSIYVIWIKVTLAILRTF